MPGLFTECLRDRKAERYLTDDQEALEAALHSLLGALTSETYSDPTQHLEREQALAKQFAEILHFTLRFDELKMTNPAIQNDFSYYRRTLSRMRINNIPAEGENEVNNELANRISLFYADATPMLKALSDGTTKFVSENKNLPIENTTDCLSTMATVEYRSRFSSEETVSFCLRVMVGVIILYDYVHPVGAFAKSSKIDMKGCIKVLKDQPPNSVDGLLNALRWARLRSQKRRSRAKRRGGGGIRGDGIRGCPGPEAGERPPATLSPFSSCNHNSETDVRRGVDGFLSPPGRKSGPQDDQWLVVFWSLQGTNFWVSLRACRWCSSTSFGSEMLTGTHFLRSAEGKTLIQLLWERPSPRGYRGWDNIGPPSIHPSIHPSPPVLINHPFARGMGFFNKYRFPAGGGEEADRCRLKVRQISPGRCPESARASKAAAVPSQVSPARKTDVSAQTIGGRTVERSGPMEVMFSVTEHITEQKLGPLIPSKKIWVPVVLLPVVSAVRALENIGPSQLSVSVQKKTPSFWAHHRLSNPC
ncbi:unnamed protein product [Menidia menidia]|uniref:(Atlantic silverside) hypothetical protein n=1 Tax=Menidia menidia TaxID=238744 RepID=A0A8S4B0K0_9TELE|nr:unnamed protein product [Menidia menidia]